MWAVIQLNAARLFAAAQTPRKISGDDWTDRVPLVLGAVIVVLLVNGIGMYFVSRARKNERSTGGQL